MRLTISVENGCGRTICSAEGENQVSLLYKDEYKEGDRIVLSCSQPGFFEIMLEDTMQQTLVYVPQRAVFAIPFGMMQRISYSPRSFVSLNHLLTARAANPELIYARRNLALNPYDQRGETGMYPHAHASVETRGEALFAARNAIDGIFENSCHYPYPYQSWGINEDPTAELTVDFGVPVDLDSVVLTLRADYPHDSHWTRATIVFSDGSKEVGGKEVLHLEKSAERQVFPVAKKGITALTLCELIKADDPSPFPALTQIEAWGRVRGAG